MPPLPRIYELTPRRFPHGNFQKHIFSHLLTTDALSKTDKGVDLGFLPKKRENNTFFSTRTGVVDALCKKQEGAAPSRSGKKVTKVTQARLFERLKGKVKISWRLVSNARFLGATKITSKQKTCILLSAFNFYKAALPLLCVRQIFLLKSCLHIPKIHEVQKIRLHYLEVTITDHRLCESQHLS